MGLGTEVFTIPGSKFKAVCINPVEDPERNFTKLLSRID